MKIASITEIGQFFNGLTDIQAIRNHYEHLDSRSTVALYQPRHPTLEVPTSSPELMLEFKHTFKKGTQSSFKDFKQYIIHYTSK